ncbi:MAG: putative porin [Syntrophobacteraceae bacterium]
MWRGSRLIPVIALLLSFLYMALLYPEQALCAQTAAAPAPAPAPDQSSDAVGAVVDLLKAKGVISGEDAAALSQKLAKPGGSAEGIGAVMDLLKQKGVISAEEAAAIKQKYEKPAAAAAAAPAPERRVIRIVHEDKAAMQEISKNVAGEIKDQVHDQLKSEIEQDMAKLQSQVPDWVTRIQWGGDIRIRYDANYYGKNNAILLNPANPTQILNTTNDTNAALIRAQLEAIAKINDQFSTDIRISTGNDTQSTSINADLGSYFTKGPIVLDRALVNYTPCKDVNIATGIIGNPFFHTDMLWEPAVAFEGIAVTAKRNIYEGLGAFVNAGIFPLDDESQTSRHRFLVAGQLGTEVVPAELVKATVGVTYYDYENIVGLASPADQPTVNVYSAPSFQQKGNTLFDITPASSTVTTGLASDFKLLNVTGTVDLAFWDPVHVILLGDYVKNVGFDRASVAALTGDRNVQEQTTGYTTGVAVGHPEIVKFPDWQVFCRYEYLEADAAVDAFTDAYFHAGGTNAKGWVLGAQLGVAKNVWLAARWYSTDQISGPPLSIDTLLLDLNTRF